MDMGILITQEKFLNLTDRSNVEMKCDNCSKNFVTKKKNLFNKLSRKESILSTFSRKICCSHKCNGRLRDKHIDTICTNCGKNIIKSFTEFKKNTNHFCSRHCSGKWNNAHKTTGSRRSKLEIYLEKQLPILHPNLVFKFNDRTEILAELDIYIPELKLAFELNGIFHYEPIYGLDKLTSTQRNDKQKIIRCYEKGIELCIIDTSKQKYFKENT